MQLLQEVGPVSWEVKHGDASFYSDIKISQTVESVQVTDTFVTLSVIGDFSLLPCS